MFRHRVEELTRRELLGRGVEAAIGFGSISAGLSFVGARRPASPSALVARLVLETKREDTLEILARAVRERGLGIRDVAAGIHRAGARRVIPTRYLGSEFHALLMAHPFAVATELMPPEVRWEPILLAADYFKKVEALHLERGAATSLQELNGVQDVSAERARARLMRALDDWDVDAAEVAVIELARAAGRVRTFDVLFRYGGRDLRQIGHKTILVANTWHVSAAVPWAECGPALRSLVRGLLLHEKGNPKERNSLFDAPWRRSMQAIGRLQGRLLEGSADRTRAFLGAFRSESSDDVSKRVVKLFNEGASIDSFWTACSCAAAEFLFSWPASLVTLHAVTTMNALRTSFDCATMDETRRLLVLQSAARLVGFRDEARRLLGDVVHATQIEELEPMTDGTIGIARLASADLPQAEKAGRMLAIAGERDHAGLWREFIPKISKHALDIHEIKHAVAVYEDARRMKRRWADRYLALSARDFRLAAGEPIADHAKHAHKFCRDASCAQRVRAAIRTIRG